MVYLKIPLLWVVNMEQEIGLGGSIRHDGNGVEMRKKIEKQSGAHRCRPVRLRNIRFTSPGSQGEWTNPNFNRWVNRSSGSWGNKLK
jgi:hypothetical protein